jgi:poly(3-hydroxybutyrate) depolymerase
MLYDAYKAYRDLSAPGRWMAGLAAETIRQVELGQLFWPMLPFAAACEMLEGVALTHERPDWNFGPILVKGRQVGLTEETVLETPFARLVRFRKTPHADQPKVLVLAPISGHFATLLRPTVETLLEGHDVYITDWKNARDVPVGEGRFGFDEHIEHVLQFMRAVGPGAHLFSVCQPCPSAIAATALMSEDRDPATPLSLTLMAGPVDPRINPTAVSSFATQHPIEWFERSFVSRVPLGSGGYRRKVYPGFIQISAFMSMNLERHLSTHVDMFRALARGEAERAEPIRAFYDEYYAVSDMTAEFFLETVEKVFQQFLLPQGLLEWRGRRVDPGAIDRTALLTIEGERDDICSPGQTAAAHELLTGLPAEMKAHHLQEGAGHYGVFSGSRWREGVYPAMKAFIAARDAKKRPHLAVS